MKVYVRNIKWNLADSQDSSLYPKQATIKIPDNFSETFTKDEITLGIETRLISTFGAQSVSAEYQFNLKEEQK